jgi:hypothetical protein
MPNHVTNKIILLGKKEELESLLKKIRNEKENEPIDFNKILPMPKILHEVSSPPKIISEAEYEKEMAIFNDKKRVLSDSEKMCGITHGITQKLHDQYMKKYDAVDWYDWACKNWGTKWNAYDQSIGEFEETNSGFGTITIIFDTAWSTPYPVIVKLAKMFPNIRMELRWADEDLGSNTGICKFAQGVCTDEYMPQDGSNEAYELVFELKEGSKDYFKLVDGKYVYDEESN